MIITPIIQRNHLVHSVPSEIDINIQKFCRELVPGRLPFFVPIRPEADSEKFYCFKNVYFKVQRDGGFIFLGWDITNASNKFLEAEYHAVWQSPTGEFIDVTPPQVVNATQSLFLIDIARADATTFKGIHHRNRKFYL